MPERGAGYVLTTTGGQCLEMFNYINCGFDKWASESASESALQQ